MLRSFEIKLWSKRQQTEINQHIYTQHEHRCKENMDHSCVFLYENTQTGSEWSQGLLLPMTVMLTTGAFIKSAVPGREKEGERKDGCEYGASRDGCKMKDGQEEAKTLLRIELGQRTTRRTK